MHDLEKHLSGTDLIDVLYPRYWHDYYLQECGEDTDDETPEVKVSKQEERDACERILLEIFGTPTYKTLTDIKNQHEEDKELLAKVFGEKFPKVFFRLEQRLVKEIDDYRKYESYKRGSCSSSS